LPNPSESESRKQFCKHCPPAKVKPALQVYSHNRGAVQAGASKIGVLAVKPALSLGQIEELAGTEPVQEKTQTGEPRQLLSEQSMLPSQSLSIPSLQVVSLLFWYWKE
jgi:hypothetical protein